jgi:catechol 2,3-dioxygenase-like lactoylglutathione lyase family enzyme
VSIRGLDHVAVTSEDLERSLDFYRDLLGIPVLDRGESAVHYLGEITGFEGARLRWADLDLGHSQVLELLHYVDPQGERLSQRTNDPGSAHIGLAVDDLAAMHKALIAAGVVVRSEPVTIDEPGGWGGVRCLYAVDPDGVTIELVERPPRPAP